MVACAVGAAWIEFALKGVPYVATVPQVYPNNFAGPHGFPLWVRCCHFLNFLFVTMLIRGGISILMDHPRLYFNDGCTPGSEWIRFTPLKVRRDRLWTAKDDARYISPVIGTPGYRHTIGVRSFGNGVGQMKAARMRMMSISTCCLTSDTHPRRGRAAYQL